jgi:hypothetical protein
MKLVSPFLLVLCLAVGFCPQAQAASIQDLIQTLTTHRSYKVRLTAVLGISKYRTPEAVAILRKTLRKRREHLYVRGFAALGLGRMKATEAIQDLQKASRARSRFLRYKAKRALRMLCPRSLLRRKRFYISLAKSHASGPMASRAKVWMLGHIRRLLANRRNVTTRWYGCRKPRSWMLRRRRMMGFYIRTNLKTTYRGGRLKTELSVLFTTYPGDAIKASVSASAAAVTSPGEAIMRRLVKAVTGHLRSDIAQFLDSRR